MKKIISIIVISWTGLFFQTNSCPPGGKDSHGNVLTGDEAAFNRKKNRSITEPQRTPQTVRIKSLQSGRSNPSSDRDRWQEGAFVEISDAFLIEAHQGGPETCNCNTNDVEKRDVHINIGTETDLINKNNNLYVIVEITPPYKRKHPDYMEELHNLTGKKVTVRGYLFYDKEHERNSINYCSICSGNGVWRKTCWEIHPVTFIGETK